MQARHFLLLILLITTTSFFWEDEEKQLQHLQQSGETALQKKDFEAAKKAFEELFGRISLSGSQKSRVDWPTYCGIATKLVQAWEGLGNREEADAVLNLVLAKNPPKELAFPFRLMKARLNSKGEAPLEAWLEMVELKKELPIEFWGNQEISLYRALQETLDTHYDELLRKGRLLLAAKMYPEAILIYDEIHNAIKKGGYPKVRGKDSLIAKIVRFRLAECHYLSAQYSLSLNYLTDLVSSDSIDKEMLFLSALCFQEQKEYEIALEQFAQYTQSGSAEELLHYDQALFEMGHHYFQNKQWSKAKPLFERVQNHKTSRASQLAALLLAQIYLSEKKAVAADKILSPLEHQVTPEDSILYESYYLRGVAAYDLGNYTNARDLIESALQQRKKESWTDQAFLQLGWCYLHLADDLSKGDAARRHYFIKAEEAFEKIIENGLSAEKALSLSQLYLQSFRHFHEDESLQKMDKILLAASDLFTFEQEHQALLLRAETVSSYEEREGKFRELTHEKYSLCPFYGHSWYLRGLNHFREGVRRGEPLSPYFDKAVIAFEKAFEWLHPKEKELATHILKMEAKANLQRDFPLHSFTNLEKVLQDFDEHPDEREESYYLKGLLAAQMASPDYCALAEEAFKKIVADYPNGKRREAALFKWATLAFQRGAYKEAKELFCQYTSDYSKAAAASEAWFWAAEAAAKCGEDPSSLMRHVYEDYPNSPYAPEAYFRGYPYHAYAEGKLEALRHLKEFSIRFPDSPLEILANYHLAHHQESLQEARNYFEKGLEAFSRYQQKVQTLDPLYIHFRYQIIVDLAERYLAESSSFSALEACEKLLISLISEFADQNHPLSSLLKEKSSYPEQYEEAEFKLVQCYLKEEKWGAAQQKLDEMLLNYKNRGIKQSPYLPHVWLEQGRLAMRSQDFFTAISCFDLALAGTKMEPMTELHLTLWILQSECYRYFKQYDTAMRLLSRVINAETASPLRIKAMLLRAEIYELEGRPELAIRQLEAAAKKGGEWALVAKEKLKRSYGIE